MTIFANQPFFMPCFPYWQLIHAADVFIICDDYVFIKGGWVNRKPINDIQMVELDVPIHSSLYA